MSYITPQQVPYLARVLSNTCHSISLLIEAVQKEGLEPEAVAPMIASHEDHALETLDLLPPSSCEVALSIATSASPRLLDSMPNQWRLSVDLTSQAWERLLPLVDPDYVLKMHSKSVCYANSGPALLRRCVDDHAWDRVLLSPAYREELTVNGDMLGHCLQAAKGTPLAYALAKLLRALAADPGSDDGVENILFDALEQGRLDYIRCLVAAGVKMPSKIDSPTPEEGARMLLQRVQSNHGLILERAETGDLESFLMRRP